MKNFLQIVIRGRHGIHVFRNLQALKWSILRYSAEFRSRDSFNQTTSKFLYEQLRKCEFKSDWIVKVDTPRYFRRVGFTRDVLDTAGSLSDGGRFNIGGAQSSSIVTNLFRPIGEKRCALYVSEDASIARKEFGDAKIPRSTALTYSITLRRKKSLALIDVKRALSDLSRKIPEIRDLIGSSSMNGKWVDLKRPAPCQVFGHWLIHHAPKNTNGIRFPSSHDDTVSNVCIFVADTVECKRILKASKMG